MTLFRSETLYEPEHVNVRPKSMQAEPSKNPKASRMLGNIVLVLALDEPDLAEGVIVMLGKPSDRENLRRQIEANHYLGPNDFLPHYTKSTSNANR